jgi:ferredoxin
MADANVRFERESLEGLIPVGSYIGDALRRFGVTGYERCTAEHDCIVEIRSGDDLLSPLTSAETEHFGAEERKAGERLACHTRIERPGEIVVMTKERKPESKTEEPSGDQYRKEFAELPFEKKVAELMKLEAITLGETFSFIANSPYLVFEKIGDVMAEFGMKLETKARQAQRPPEHAETGAKTSTENKTKTDKTDQE